MKKFVLHFGGGALGRGLVIPLLQKSGFDIILADIDGNLLDQIKKEGGYTLYTTDEEQNEKIQTVEIRDTISLIQETDKLKEYMNTADIITTSVRKENLKYVAKSLLSGLEGRNIKKIICAENIENVSSFFRQLLNKYTTEEKHKNIIDNLIIPDTVVDRICTSNWPKSLRVNTEKFYEFSVDKSTLSDTGINAIPSIKNIKAAFVKKRLLVNTYADGSAFFAKSKGLRYLHEAILDKETQDRLRPYFDSFLILLEKKYLYSHEELINWRNIYKDRLSNTMLKRELGTVARNLWSKIAPNERFLSPLKELLELGIGINDYVEVILDLVKSNSNYSGITLYNHLVNLWGKDHFSKKILNISKNLLMSKGG